MDKHCKCCEICVFVRCPVASIGLCGIQNKPVFLSGKCDSFIPKRQYRGMVKDYGV